MTSDTNPIPNISTVLIVGPGLLGGSVGLGLKSAGFTGKIIGDARKMQTIETAIRVGCIDEGTTELEKVAPLADLVLIATPLNTFELILEILAKHIKPGCIITDVGSTKCSVLEHVKKALTPSQQKYFVGSHPMAGSEVQGPEGADAMMLVNRPCIVTPHANTDADTVDLIENMWTRIGMIVQQMTPQQHDENSAVISHLPHLLNVLLVQTAINMGGIDMASTGFKGATRLASSNPTIRTDILDCNRGAILTVIDGFEKQLANMKQKIAEGKAEQLLDDLNQAKEFRDNWVEQFDHPKNEQDGI